MKQYSYNGPVKEFNDVIVSRWSGTTYAVSENKARSNLAYQAKKQFNRAKDTKITLPGKIEVVE